MHERCVTLSTSELTQAPTGWRGHLGVRPALSDDDDVVERMDPREITNVDRRMRHLYWEPAGKAILDTATPIVRRIQDLMLEGLTEPERATLLRLLSKALRTVGFSSRPALRSASTSRGSGR